jgi:hypothetical protein
MFRLFREIERGEFFIVFGDGAQGGADKNFVQFMSKTRGDIPLVLAMHGVTAEMVPQLHTALVWLKSKTGVKPIVALERNMGGASGMHDLMTSNAGGDYTCYFMKDLDGKVTDKLGYDTNILTRPKMLGEWLAAYNSKLIKIYDKETQEQHQTFIVNKNGKPEAAPNTHDDAVMSCAGAWQLYQSENPPMRKHRKPEIARLKFHV